MLVCSFALIATAPVAAQNATNTVKSAETESNYTKRLFASKTNELSAYISRGSTQLIDKTMNDINKLMSEAVAATNEQIKTADEGTKAELHKTFSLQRKLAADVKSKSANVVKNKAVIIKDLKEFQNTL